MQISTCLCYRHVRIGRIPLHSCLNRQQVAVRKAALGIGDLEHLVALVYTNGRLAAKLRFHS